MSSPVILFVKDHQLSSAAMSVLMSLVAYYSPSGERAVSVWARRAHPLDRGSCHLKAFNGAFSNLCDATSFGCGSHDEVFPPFPVFISQDTAAEAQSSMVALMSAVDDIHLGKSRRSSCLFVHISRLGRPQRVALEVIGIYDGEQLSEYVCVESLLPPVALPMRTSATPFEYTAPHPQMPPPDLLQPAKENVAEHMYNHFMLDKNLSRGDWVFVEDEKQRRRSKVAPIHCSSCGDTETTQRRYDRYSL